MPLSDFTNPRQKNPLRNVRPKLSEACEATEDGEWVYIVVEEVSEKELGVLYFELVFLVKSFNQASEKVGVDFFEADFALQ